MNVARTIAVAGILVLPGCQTNAVLGDPCAGMANCDADDGGTTGNDTNDDVMTTASPTTLGTSSDPDTGSPGNPTAGPMTTSVPDEGDPDPPPGSICIPTCTSDADCTIMGSDYGLACSQILDICFLPCDTDQACQAVGSGWTAQPCESNDDCFAGPCVDYAGNGVGGCGTDANRNDCSVFMQEPVEAQDINGADVLVCASTALVCENFNGEMTCLAADMGTPPPTCDDFMCPDPLTCSEADPACNCTNVDDCVAAGIGNSFDGGYIDCRPFPQG